MTPLEAQHTFVWFWPSGTIIKKVSENETISIYMSHMSTVTLLRLTIQFSHKTILPHYMLRRACTQTHSLAEWDACEHVTCWQWMQNFTTPWWRKRIYGHLWLPILWWILLLLQQLLLLLLDFDFVAQTSAALKIFWDCFKRQYWNRRNLV